MPTPPSSLLRPTPEPRLSEPSNAGLLEYALDLRAALRKANVDKAALRMFFDDASARSF